MAEPFYDAADELARRLRDEPWYHRTTVLEESRLDNGRRVWGVVLRVWGTGGRPATLPTEFRGYPVVWCRVSRRNPCPFGSVKP